MGFASASHEPQLWTRTEAIEQLRGALRKLSDGQHSMCQVAAEGRMFCHGFRRWPDHEFHARWKPILGSSTHLTRPQMEELANLWQLTEQVRMRVDLACDAQASCPGACRGWSEFSNETLARHCDEVLGRNVVVTDHSCP